VLVDEIVYKSANKNMLTFQNCCYVLPVICGVISFLCCLLPYFIMDYVVCVCKFNFIGGLRATFIIGT